LPKKLEKQAVNIYYIVEDFVDQHLSGLADRSSHSIGFFDEFLFSKALEVCDEPNDDFLFLFNVLVFVHLHCIIHDLGMLLVLAH